MKLAREYEPSHPEAADPGKYAQGLNLSLEKRKGAFFDSFIFWKGRV